MEEEEEEEEDEVLEAHVAQLPFMMSLFITVMSFVLRASGI